MLGIFGKINGTNIEFSEHDENEYNLFCAANQGRKVFLSLDFETRQRTEKQNNSLWLGMEMLARALNDGGLYMNKILRVDIDWTKNTCMEQLFRPIMKALLGKQSTTELTKDEISKVWDVLFRELSEKHGVEYIPYPNKLNDPHRDRNIHGDI